MFSMYKDYRPSLLLSTNNRSRYSRNCVFTSVNSITSSHLGVLKRIMLKEYAHNTRKEENGKNQFVLERFVEQRRN